MRAKREKEPAYTSYFFGPGWYKMKEFVVKILQKNADDARKYYSKYKTEWNSIFSVRAILNLIATLSVLVWGTIFTAGIGILHTIILTVFMTFMYIMFGIIWSIDRIILWKRKISHVCTNCQRQYLFPIYVCSCGRKHKRLAPGRYGILVRKCECGTKLPTSGLKKVGGLKRKDLPAICPFCTFEDNQGESVQISIPIGGGRSSGKSVFINAFVYDFVEEIALNNEFDVDPYNNAYNEKMRDQYKIIKQFYQRGESKRTEKQNDRTKSSSRDFSFWVNHKKFAVPKLIHVLDIDGETFVSGTENYVPEQYQYCKGTVLIIDPFSITSFRNQVFDTLGKEDQDGIGPEPIENVLNSFVLKLHSVLQLRSSQKIEMPVAIGIAKIDAADLETRIGETAVRKLMSEEPEQYKDYYKTMDYLCRQFLKDNGESAFIRTVDVEFKNVYFFAFSALGHALRKGRYHPRGVMEIMQWIIGQGDSDMKKIWNVSKN